MRRRRWQTSVSNHLNPQSQPRGAKEEGTNPLTQSIYRRERMTGSYKPSAAMIEKYRDLPTKARPEPADPPIGLAYISFEGSSSIGIKQLRQFVQFIDQNSYFTGILITAAPVSAAALKIGTTIHPRILEVFHESDLLVNITKHELVPKHVLLSKEEKMKLLQRYRLKETQLPRIQFNDPVAKYLGLRKGQVVKIIRKSETAGRYASYRWCI